MEINNFQGDLTDISAEKEALLRKRCGAPDIACTRTGGKALS